MEFEIASSESNRGITNGTANNDAFVILANRDAPEVQVIVKAAQDELRRLMRRRVEITRRIATVKQTIAGLCHLIGDSELGDDLGALGSGTVRRREQELQP